MSTTLTIGTNPFKLIASSGRLNLELNRRCTLDFVLRDPRPVGVGSSPKIGNTITLQDTVLGVVYFKGFIDAFDVENRPTDDYQMYVLSCKDFNSIADRRIVTGSWTNVNAGNIASEIVDNFLADDGVTHASVASGPVIPSFSVEGVTATEALDQLCQNTGQVTADTTMAWFIDFNKDLHLFPANIGTGTASFQISDTSNNWETVKMTKDGSNYANRVTVHSGSILSDSDTTDTLHGDGSTRAFTTTAPVGSVPVIKLNGGAALTVGVNGVDTGKQYYYSLGSDSIEQDVSETVLVLADNLAVTYKPILSDNVVMSEDTGEQANRRVYEGGSGIHEIRVDNSTAGVVSDAQNLADALLKQHVTIPVTLEVTMDSNVNIPQPGQLVTTTLVHYGFPDPVLCMIQNASAEIKSRSVPGGNADCYFEWTFQMVRGAYQAGWEKVLWGDTGTSAAGAAANIGDLAIAFA